MSTRRYEKLISREFEASAYRLLPASGHASRRERCWRGGSGETRHAEVRLVVAARVHHRPHFRAFDARCLDD